MWTAIGVPSMRTWSSDRGGVHIRKRKRAFKADIPERVGYERGIVAVWSETPGPYVLHERGQELVLRRRMAAWTSGRQDCVPTSWRCSARTRRQLTVYWRWHTSNRVHIQQGGTVAAYREGSIPEGTVPVSNNVPDPEHKRSGEDVAVPPACIEAVGQCRLRRRLHHAFGIRRQPGWHQVGRGGASTSDDGWPCIP